MDSADLKVVAAVKSEGRKSYADIARETGLTEATVRRRLKQLLDDGVISIVVIPDPVKIGLPVHVLMSMQVDLERLGEVTQQLAGIPNVRWVGIVTGAYNVIAEAFFASNAQMNRVMTGRLAKIAGIVRLEVQTVLELVSRTYNWETMREESANGHDGVAEAPADARVSSTTAVHR